MKLVFRYVVLDNYGYARLNYHQWDRISYSIIRTGTPNGDWTGKAKSQHIIALRSTGEVTGRLYDGKTWLDFTAPKVFKCPDPAYVKGNVEFLVLWDKD